MQLAQTFTAASEADHGLIHIDEGYELAFNNLENLHDQIEVLKQQFEDDYTEALTFPAQVEDKKQDVEDMRIWVSNELHLTAAEGI